MNSRKETLGRGARMGVLYSFMVLAAPAANECGPTTEPPPCEETNTCPAFDDERYGGHQQQELDIYLPTNGNTNARIILFVHAGLFHDMPDPDVAKRFPPQAIMAQRANGWGIVTLTYRSPPEYVAPTQIQDIKRAIMWLRTKKAANDPRLAGLDPSHIVIAGSSGGSLLSAMVGLTQTNYQPTDLSEGIAGKSSAVQGMIIWQGPDLSAIAAANQVNPTIACHGNVYLNCKVGGVASAAPPACPFTSPSATCSEAELSPGSPHKFVGPEDPPIYLAYGSSDDFIGPASALRIAQHYPADKLWVDYVSNGEHTFEYTGINEVRLGCFLRGLAPTAPCP